MLAGLETEPALSSFISDLPPVLVFRPGIAAVI
jgi:hypothetical protein